MKLFKLQRNMDVSGVSGTGIVAQGVVFDNGKCAMQWLTALNSMAIYEDVATLLAIHEHDGKTKMIFIEGDK